jgi:uncharacterized YigZ family protein
MPTVRTIARPLSFEIPKIKGSRFIAAAARAESAEAARAFVEARRRELPDATHHCFAWRLGRGENAFRTADDGEPSGTAGRPILQQIDARRLTDVAVVVSRYFGGTKLGTGGLVRAYGGAAAEVLARAGVVELPVVAVLRLGYGYEQTGAVRGVLASFGLAAERPDYGAAVRVEVAVPVEEVEDVRRALRDATGGRIEIEEG